MVREYRTEEDLIQNLKAAGCDEDTIRAFLNDLQDGKQSKGVKLLEQHRRALLDGLHQEQRRIDCLDYLLYMLQKREG